MENYIKKILREGLLRESRFEVVPFHEDVDLIEYNLDESDAEGQALEVAKEGGVRILSNKDLNAIIIDNTENEVIGGLWVTNSGQEFSFDVAINPRFRGMGLATQLIDAAIEEYEQQKEVYGEELPIEVDVINPLMAEILSKKYGFHVTGELGPNRVLMSL